MQDHFGLSLIFNWVEKECERIANDNEIMNGKELMASLHQEMLIHMVCVWRYIGEALMDYIVNSEDQPLVEITWYWWHWEYLQEICICR